MLEALLDDTQRLQSLPSALDSYFEDFSRSHRNVSEPVRLLRLASGLSQGDGAAFYGVGEKNYRVETHYSTLNKTSCLVHDIDSVAEVTSLPAKHWDTPPVNGTPVIDPQTLDQLERFIISTTKPNPAFVEIIRRDGSDYQITPQGKVNIPQQTPFVA